MLKRKRELVSGKKCFDFVWIFVVKFFFWFAERDVKRKKKNKTYHLHSHFIRENSASEWKKKEEEGKKTGNSWTWDTGNSDRPFYEIILFFMICSCFFNAEINDFGASKLKTKGSFYLLQIVLAHSTCHRISAHRGIKEEFA